MSGNASNKIKELGQCAELIGSIAKAMALVAPKMTKQARQSWIGLPPADFARVLEKQIFLPVEPEHIIDLDATPYIPGHLSLEEHRKGGKLAWSHAVVQLYLSDMQKNIYVDGNDLRKELADKPVLNACVLDYLIDHPHLIPEEWKSTEVFFWGTVYRDRRGNLYVPYLCWSSGEWCRYAHPNGYSRYSGCRVAILAN